MHVALGPKEFSMSGHSNWLPPPYQSKQTPREHLPPLLAFRLEAIGGFPEFFCAAASIIYWGYLLSAFH